ncbi:MAG: FTR1 family iron permease [Deltaproteobacteria bacterium]|jgi:high-affinity iron transporter|nr:FTR1 family iron permease [Deltaproteobacteria bacterium]
MGKRAWIFLGLGLLGGLALSSVALASAYNSWAEVAAAMEQPLNQAHAVYLTGDREASRDLVNDAYFQFYEKEGFERNVKSRVSGKRAATVEYKFARIKTKIKEGAPAEEVRAEIDILIGWLREDALALDGPKEAAANSSAASGAASSASSSSSQGSASGQGSPSSQGSASAHGWAMLLAALGTLLREGFEAILVIAAIAAYLKRSGNEKSIPVVYKSAVWALVASVAAAIGLKYVLNLGGQNQEILEGATMLLATVVLFSVSNWMFSKAEAENWKSYIEGKVQSAVTKGSALALGAAAFLAVFREGAETILFYQSILTEAGDDRGMVWIGFAIGCVALVVVFILIRHGSARLPLKPFFIGTSALMFIMSIAFAGGGIKELQEGDAIGVTEWGFMPTIDILGVYPTMETTVPQIVLLILTIGSIVYILRKNAHVRARAAAMG